MADIRVRLLGGPEDGREVNVDADASGRPLPRVTLPAPRPPTIRTRTPEPPLLVYERHVMQADGVWAFHYVGVQYG